MKTRNQAEWAELSSLLELATDVSAVEDFAPTVTPPKLKLNLDRDRSPSLFAPICRPGGSIHRFEIESQESFNQKGQLNIGGNLIDVRLQLNSDGIGGMLSIPDGIDVIPQGLCFAGAPIRKRKVFDQFVEWTSTVSKAPQHEQSTAPATFGVALDRLRNQPEAQMDDDAPEFQVQIVSENNRLRISLPRPSQQSPQSVFAVVDVYLLGKLLIRLHVNESSPSEYLAYLPLVDSMRRESPLGLTVQVEELTPEHLMQLNAFEANAWWQASKLQVVSLQKTDQGYEWNLSAEQIQPLMVANPLVAALHYRPSNA